MKFSFFPSPYLRGDINPFDQFNNQHWLQLSMPSLAMAIATTEATSPYLWKKTASDDEAPNDGDQGEGHDLGQNVIDEAIWLIRHNDVSSDSDPSITTIW